MLSYAVMVTMIQKIYYECFDKYVTTEEVTANSTFETYYDRRKMTYKDGEGITVNLRSFKDGQLYFSATDGTNLYKNNFIQKGTPA